LRERLAHGRRPGVRERRRWGRLRRGGLVRSRRRGRGRRRRGLRTASEEQQGEETCSRPHVDTLCIATMDGAADAIAPTGSRRSVLPAAPAPPPRGVGSAGERASMRTEILGGLTACVTGGTDGKGGGDGPVVVLLHGFGAPGTDLVALGPALS